VIHRIFTFSSPILGDMVMRSERRSTHRVLMNFMDRHGWHISFLEPDCQTSLPVKLTFASADKIRTMHQRFGSPLLEDGRLWSTV
jgi:hypothetical protein